MTHLTTIPTPASSTHPHLTPPRLHRAAFPPSLPAAASLSSRCCHANFPGDSVVMDTERQGRSADVWCRSGMCTNRSRVCRARFVCVIRAASRPPRGVFHSPADPFTSVCSVTPGDFVHRKQIMAFFSKSRIRRTKEAVAVCQEMMQIY